MDVIKKAFRKLAHEYHPDKNQGNVFSATHFREIREAYSILSDKDKKAAYDHERWLSGRFKKDGQAITPEYLLQEVYKLNVHLSAIDIYRMNKQLLFEYLLFLLQDNHISVLQRKGARAISEQLISSILNASGNLPFYYEKDIIARLYLLASDDLPLQTQIATAERKRKAAEKWRRSYPWLITAITILLCAAMYLFGKKD